jgi:hypothetical protein
MLQLTTWSKPRRSPAPTLCLSSSALRAISPRTAYSAFLTAELILLPVSTFSPAVRAVEREAEVAGIGTVMSARGDLRGDAANSKGRGVHKRESMRRTE